MSSLLVKIHKIEAIEKHPNADTLDIATVEGWNCITKSGQYKVGDLVVFIPPDSILPESMIKEYKLDFLKNGGRVGTVKLRGVVSQGLVLEAPAGYYEGDDVAKFYGITKYEVPEPEYNPASGNRKTAKKGNPYLKKYTDIENIKNYPDVFTEADLVVISEKIHGCSSRYSNLPIVIDGRYPFFYKIGLYFKKYILGQTHEFVYGSHNMQKFSNSKSYYGDDVWGRIAKKYDLANKIPKDYIVFGEVYGKKIQDLTYGLDDIDLVVFDVMYKGEYLSFEAMDEFCEELGLPTVPVIYIGAFRNDTVEKYTSGNSLICPTQIREGVVIKSYEESAHPKIGRKILKSINPDYLLRKGGTEFK